MFYAGNKQITWFHMFEAVRQYNGFDNTQAEKTLEAMDRIVLGEHFIMDGVRYCWDDEIKENDYRMEE